MHGRNNGKKLKTVTIVKHCFEIIMLLTRRSTMGQVAFLNLLTWYLPAEWGRYLLYLSLTGTSEVVHLPKSFTSGTRTSTTSSDSVWKLKSSASSICWASSPQSSFWFSTSVMFIKYLENCV